MAALRSITPDDRAEAQQDLALTLNALAKCRHGRAALLAEGEPEDSTSIQKLDWQIESLEKWERRYRADLEAFA